MFPTIDALPWDSLELRQPDIPWDDLRALASAAQSDDVCTRLLGRLREHLDRRYAPDADDYSDLTDHSVLAVLALAAERLSEQSRRDVAGALLDALYRAGTEDDDFTLGMIEQAGGRFGPALIEPALRLIATHGNEMECWFCLFSLLRVAREAPPEMRARVINMCRQKIRESEDRFATVSSIDAPADLLRALHDTDSLPLLENIQREAHNTELEHIIREMRSAADAATRDEYPWTVPVETWLPEKVAVTRQYLADCDRDEAGEQASGRSVDEAAYVEYDGDDEEEASAYAKYGDLGDRFVESDAFRELPEEVKEHTGFAVSVFLKHAYEHIGTPIEELSPVDVDEVMLAYYPRKITAERDFFVHAPAALIGFFCWLNSEGRLPQADRICETVRRCAGEMLERSQDASNWGPAKRFAMSAQSEGVDIANPEEMQAYQVLHTLRQLQRREEQRRAERVRRALEAETIVRPSAKVGRNEPCPCGSGKKYKKCCG